VDTEDGANGTNEAIGEVFAGPRLDRHDRRAAPAALTALLDVPRAHRVWVVAAFLLGAITCDALGDPDAVERALDLAEAGKMLSPFYSQPAPGLLDHQARHCAVSAALISEAVDLLARAGRPAPPGELTRRGEPLTQGETRVLHYLSSNLSAPSAYSHHPPAGRQAHRGCGHDLRARDDLGSKPGADPASRYLRPGNR
jgi:hypothetical protein